MIDTNGLQREWPTEPAGSGRERPSPLTFLRELPALIVMAVLTALLIKTFLLQAFYIPSGSMEPTLEGCQPRECPDGKHADRVIVNKFAYRFRPPRRGEIIVFIAQKDDTPKSLFQKVKTLFTEGIGVSPPAGETDYIKRVIGLPGETISVDPRGVVIRPRKGKPFRLREPYTFSRDEPGPSMQPYTIPAGFYFVMGDNRANSSDSRGTLGPIAKERIIGKAFVRIWPWYRLSGFEEPTYRNDPSSRARTRAAALPAPVLVAAMLARVPLRERRARARRDAGGRGRRARDPSG